MRKNILNTEEMILHWTDTVKSLLIVGF